MIFMKSKTRVILSKKDLECIYKNRYKLNLWELKFFLDLFERKGEEGVFPYIKYDWSIEERPSYYVEVTTKQYNCLRDIFAKMRRYYEK